MKYISNLPSIFTYIQTTYNPILAKLYKIILISISKNQTPKIENLWLT